jgi:hypothetical protein
MTTRQVTWKYPLWTGSWGVAPSARHDVEMPSVSSVLALQVQRDTPTLWVQVDPKSPVVTRTFEWVGTGYEVPAGGEYIGTVQLQDGAFVFHLYEVAA